MQLNTLILQPTTNQSQLDYNIQRIHMSNITIVTGAGHGDEGKGLMVDYFAENPDNRKNAIVVRYNGGSQAGHTVQTPSGTRHVFSHFGSGTFVHTPTYLSKFFVCNPLIYVLERECLLDLEHCKPKVFVHSDALVSTPYDMIINQILENRRGEGKHGSCGIGFGETIARAETFSRITVGDLFDPGLRSKLEDIRLNYIKQRFENSPLDSASPSDNTLMQFLESGHEIVEDWLSAVEVFIDDIQLMKDNDLTHDSIIFEGAQGLLLDQKSEDFPHVTRSSTGAENVISIMNNMTNIEDINVVYVSRAYSTRHGAGPMPHEQDLPYDITDLTNITNPNQGSVRYGPLHLDRLSDVTFSDFNKYADAGYSQASVCMAFTCLDQIANKGLFIAGGELTQTTVPQFINVLHSMGFFVSYGPTREDVIKMADE